jgi:UMP-CMP kinase
MVNLAALEANSTTKVSKDKLAALLCEAQIAPALAETHARDFFQLRKNPPVVKVAEFIEEFKRMILFMSIRELSGATKAIKKSDLQNRIAAKTDAKVAASLVTALGVTTDVTFAELKNKYTTYHRKLRATQQAPVSNQPTAKTNKPVAVASAEAKASSFQAAKSAPTKLSRPSTQPAKTATAPGTARPHEVVFVLGGPGAGKGTQCAKLAANFDFVHLSAGDLLRAEKSKPGSNHAELINTYIKEGKIVPVEITVQLLLNAMDANRGKRFLIDGFPRNEDNRDGWYATAGTRANVSMVLFYDCPLEELKRRLLHRGETSGRSDDNMESIIKRFETFQRESMPVVEWYAANV